MRSALIGYTGFIGSNLKSKFEFTDFYNSSNIESIKGKEYDLIVSAGTSSLRWIADLEPEADWQSIEKLLNPLSKAKAKQFVLVSTVDVYPTPAGVNEDSPITLNRPLGYGLNRYKMELFVRENFKKSLSVRLPQTFAKGLKKNFIFDLLYKNALDFTHKDSKFQWYNLENLWKDISVALDNNLQIINLAVEPISCWEIAHEVFDLEFENVTQKKPLNYDMHTKYANLYNKQGNYIYYREEVLEDLKQFVKEIKTNI